MIVPVGGVVVLQEEQPAELQQAVVEQILQHRVELRRPAIRESAFSRFAKRSADIIIATVALVICLPIWLILAFLIWAEDRGNVFYGQCRIGHNGIPFRFYKFRSMRIDADTIRETLLTSSDAEGAAFKMKNDPRITRIGRFIRKYSLDETPQFLSVLVGHMSIVGPRPHLPEEVETYASIHHARLLVKPGLVCFREVRGRSHLSFDEWLRLDLEYLENRSLLLDLRIFFMAIPAILSGEGAY